jgi:hypothetical protein
MTKARARIATAVTPPASRYVRDGDGVLDGLAIRPGVSKASGGVIAASISPSLVIPRSFSQPRNTCTPACTSPRVVRGRVSLRHPCGPCLTVCAVS